MMDLLKKQIKNKWYILFLFFLPFICIACLLFVTGNKFNFSILKPVWNDEVGWWTQIDAVKSYGMPLGYSGYDLTHAAIGTYGPWGATTNYPYALFALVFGWNYHSMALANMFYLGLALAFFCFITKGTLKQAIWMCGLYLCCFITIGYSLTSMSEGVRYANGLILAGLLVYYERKMKAETIVWKTKDILCLIAAIVFILFAINLYLIYALFIPAFCWVFFRKIKTWKRIIICLVATILISYGEQVTISLVSAPYSQSVFERWGAVYKEQGLYQTIVYIIKSTFANLETINPAQVIQSGDHNLWLYYLMYLVAMATAIIRCSCYRSFYNVLQAYLLVGLLIGYCVLYTGSGWTLCRGTNSAFFIAAMLLCIGEQSENRNLRLWIVGITMLGSIQIWNYYSGMINERYTVSAYEREIIEEKKVLDEIIEISPEKDRWSNTIAYYGDFDYGYLSVPTGTGINWLRQEETNDKAGYILMRTGTENQEEFVNNNVNSGHEVIHQDEMFIVLKKQTP